MKNFHDHNQLIYRALVAAFPEDTEALIKLCYHGLEEPLGSNHPHIIQEIVGARLKPDDFINIQIGYVMISTYYFLLDSVVDGHIENKIDSLYLTHLLTLACQNFDAVIYSNANYNWDGFKKMFHKLITDNAKAIRMEDRFSSNPLSYSEEEEYESIVGRSNSSIILLEIIATLAEVKNLQEIRRILMDFAFYIQLGDDLADWRDDFKSKKYSSFLREIFNKNNRILSEEELEEIIYFSSIFESRAVKIINGLNNIVKIIDDKFNENGNSLKELIKYHVSKIKVLLTEVVEIKLKATQSENG